MVVHILASAGDYILGQFEVQVGAIAKDNKLKVEKFNG